MKQLACLIPLLLPFGFASRLRAQEFTVMAGGMTADGQARGSYAWELEYRRGVDRNLNLESSVSWINEGHVAGHHRDGNAVALWWRLPVDLCRITVGAGPYFYYDTVPLEAGGTRDQHGTAGIFSVSATGNTGIPRLFWSVTAHRIDLNSDLKTTSVLVGIGAWLGERENGIPKGNLPGILDLDGESRGGSTRNELAVFGGWSVVNTFSSPGGGAFSLEYRRILTNILDASVTYIHEGATEVARRSGLGLQVWPVSRPFGDKWEIGLGVGTYVYLDRQRALPAGQINRVALAGLVSPMVSYRIGEGFIRVVWDRVVTTYNRDSDVWLLGAGHRF